MTNSHPSNDPLPFSHRCYTNDEAEAERRRIETLGMRVCGLRVDLLGAFLIRPAGTFAVVLILFGVAIAAVVPLEGFPAAMAGTAWCASLLCIVGSLWSDGWPKYNAEQQQAIGLVEPLDEAVLTGMPQVIRLTENFPSVKEAVGRWLREGKQLRQRDLLAMEEYEDAERERQRQVEYHARVDALRAG